MIYIIYRGYKIFNKNNHIDKFYNFEIDVEKFTNNQNLNKEINFNTNINFVYNQYLIRTLLTSRFKIYYLIFLGLGINLIFPLPLKWMKLIKKNNIKMNFTLSFLSFFIFCFFALIKNLYKSIKNIFHKNKIFPKNYDFIIGFDNKNFYPNFTNKNYNLIDYLSKEFSLEENILHSYQPLNLNYENYKINYSKRLFYLSLVSKFKLLIYIILILLKSIIFIFKIDFKYSVLFSELVLLKKIKLFSLDSKLANKYIFNLNFGNYRPLWTYYAEKLNSKIIFINYASGFYGLKNISKNQYPKQLSLGLYCMNWPFYVVDKKIYYDYLISNYSNKNFYLSKNQINISDNGTAIPSINKSKYTIAIFDVTPVRKFLRLLYLPQDNFRESEICIKFLSDIEEVLSNLDINILLKIKRSAISRDCKRYHNYIKTLKFIHVDSEISASRVSRECDLIIAIPFTTAAFNFNKNKKINSIFYSPYEIISRNDRAAQNTKTIIGKKELYKFIYNEINSLN